MAFSSKGQIIHLCTPEYYARQYPAYGKKKNRFVITGFDCTQLIFGSIVIEDGVNETTRCVVTQPSIPREFAINTHEYMHFSLLQDKPIEYFDEQEPLQPVNPLSSFLLGHRPEETYFFRRCRITRMVSLVYLITIPKMPVHFPISKSTLTTESGNSLSTSAQQ